MSSPAEQLELARRLSGLSKEAVLQIAVTGVATSQEASRLAGCMLGDRPLPDWARDSVLDAPDLLATILAQLGFKHAVAGVCTRWSVAWKRHLRSIKALRHVPVPLSIGEVVLDEQDDPAWLSLLPLSDGRIAIGATNGKIWVIDSQGLIVKSIACDWPRKMVEVRGGTAILVANCSLNSAGVVLSLSDGAVLAECPFPDDENDNGYSAVAVAASRAFFIPASLWDEHTRIQLDLWPDVLPPTAAYAPGIDEYGLIHVYDLQSLSYSFGLHKSDTGLLSPGDIVAVGSAEIAVVDEYAYTHIHLFSALHGQPTRQFPITASDPGRPISPMIASDSTRLVYTKDVRADKDEFDDDEPVVTAGGVCIFTHGGMLLQEIPASANTPRPIDGTVTNLSIGNDGIYTTTFTALSRPPLCYKYVLST